MGMSEFLVLIVMLILVIALVKFTAVLNEISSRLEREVDRSKYAQDRLEATVNRMELATKVVAHNLADSVSRADATDGPEGAAADAALRTGDTAEAIHARQDAAE